MLTQQRTRTNLTRFSGTLAQIVRLASKSCAMRLRSGRWLPSRGNENCGLTTVRAIAGRAFGEPRRGSMIEINQLRWSASHPHVAQPLGQIAVSHWRRQFFVAFALAALSPAAMALCLDPSDPTTTKYYHLTVEEEVRSSAAVIVGTVLKVLGLVEDLSDPEGYTAFIYTVKVTRHLKG